MLNQGRLVSLAAAHPSAQCRQRHDLHYSIYTLQSTKVQQQAVLPGTAATCKPLDRPMSSPVQDASLAGPHD